MQDHLHVGRPTVKRKIRDALILLSPLFFMAVFGVPFMRNTTPDNCAIYECIASEKYEVRAGDHAPMFLLIPLWWPHKNADGMHWVADSWIWDEKTWSDQR